MIRLSMIRHIYLQKRSLGIVVSSETVSCHELICNPPVSTGAAASRHARASYFTVACIHSHELYLKPREPADPCTVLWLDGYPALAL